MTTSSDKATNPRLLDGNPVSFRARKIADEKPTDIYPQATEAERDGLTLPGEPVRSR